jgi:DNA polymerase elongation subunit (family B)
VEWTTDAEENKLIGIGQDMHGQMARLILTICPGLFIVSRNIDMLRKIMELRGFQIFVTNKTVSANICDVEEFFTCDKIRPNVGQVVKILTSSVAESQLLFYEFKRDRKTMRYAATTSYWEIRKQIYFELLLRDETNATKNCFCWFDSNLKRYDAMAAVIFPTITFDLETVSSIPNRVPTGEHKDDILFTASIYNSKTKILHTLIHIPIQNQSPTSLASKLPQDYPAYESVTSHQVEVFVNEESIVRRTVKLLSSMKHELHLLQGYNSCGYDIKYLLLRCSFLGLYELVDKFMWRECGITLTHGQFHMDLFRTCFMLYDMPQRTLSYVSQTILNDDKEDVDAVSLRYTYYSIVKHQDLAINQNTDWPSVRDAAHYNNQDVLLVVKLAQVTASWAFLCQYADECQVSICKIQQNFDKMKFRIINECFTIGMEIGVFLANLENDGKHCAIWPYNENDYVVTDINYSKELFSSEFEGKNKKGYPGGANYCRGEYLIQNVQVYDYRIAYPLLLERCNISQETCGIFRASELLTIFDRIPRPERFESWDYHSHCGANKTLTRQLYHTYLTRGLSCGKKFNFTREELHQRNDQQVIVIWKDDRGVLSRIVEKLNNNRENLKFRRKLLDGVIATLEEKIKELESLQIEMEMDDDYDNDEITNVLNITDAGLVIFDDVTMYENITGSIAHLKIKLSNFIRERQSCENLYRLQKVRVSSITGCIGASSPWLAGIMTCIIRSTLLDAGWYMRRKYGCTVYYCDTDSLMLHNPSSEANLSTVLNARYPHTEIEMKTMERCLFVKTKTYYSWNEGQIKYGQHNQGPKVWREFITFVDAATNITTSYDIERMFTKYFKQAAAALKEDSSRYTQTIKISNTPYKTMCPVAEYAMFMAKNHPNLVGIRRHVVYYRLDETDVNKTVYRPYFRDSPPSSRNINLYKFFSNVFMTVFNLLKAKIQQESAPFEVYVDERHCRLLFLKSFLTTLETE